MSLDKNWSDFVLGEGLDKNIFTYLHGLQEVISAIKLRSITEEHRLTLAKQHIKEVRRSARKMQNEMKLLEEKLNILEESLNEGK